MFFRFGSALVLVVLISLAGTALEKRNLELRRMVSHQQYRLDVLLQQHAAHRVQAQQLGAPLRMFEQWEVTWPASEFSARPEKSSTTKSRKKRATPATPTSAGTP